MYDVAQLLNDCKYLEHVPVNEEYFKSLKALRYGRELNAAIEDLETYAYWSPNLDEAVLRIKQRQFEKAINCYLLYADHVSGQGYVSLLRAAAQAAEEEFYIRLERTQPLWRQSFCKLLRLLGINPHNHSLFLLYTCSIPNGKRK